jgi:hypothetical protein
MSITFREIERIFGQQVDIRPTPNSHEDEPNASKMQRQEMPARIHDSEGRAVSLPVMQQGSNKPATGHQLLKGDEPMKNQWYDIDKYRLAHPANPDLRINIMDFARHVCMKTDIGAIAQEAYEYAKREGEAPHSSMAKETRAKKTNEHARALWQKTDKTQARQSINRVRQRGSIRIQFSKSARRKSARASPSYGITMSVNGDEGQATGRALKVLLHEMIHVFQLQYYTEHYQGNKRRPHDIMFNRMMLKLMQPWFGLTEKECNPFNMGYSVARGYAPSRKVQRIIESKLNNNEPLRINRFFKPHVSAPKAEPTPQELAKKERSHAKRYIKAIITRCWDVHGDDIFDDEEVFTDLIEEVGHDMCWREAARHVFNSILTHDSLSTSLLSTKERAYYELILKDCKDEWGGMWQGTSDARWAGLERMDNYLKRNMHPIKPFAGKEKPATPQPEEPKPTLTWDDISVEDLRCALHRKTRARFDPRCSKEYLLSQAVRLKVVPADCVFVGDSTQTDEVIP